MKRNERGFTLMELMVVIVIVAILAAVAVPLYTNYVKDAQRTEAKGAIGAIISAEQVYYQKNPNNEFLPIANAALVDPKNALGVDLIESVRNWKFDVTSSDPSDGFVVAAVGKTGTDMEGLFVTYTHSRAGGPVWLDTAP